MTHDLDQWNSLKKNLNNISKTPFFNEKEIWWCSIGINIGSEIYGKGRTFTRPILVLKKFNKYSFLAIPLSTKIKDISGYFRLNFKGREISAVIKDIKKMDSRRLSDKIGKLSEEKFKEVKEEIKRMIFDPQ